MADGHSAERSAKALAERNFVPEGALVNPEPHHENHEIHEGHETTILFGFSLFVAFVFSCLSWLSAVRGFLHSRSAKTHSERPEMAVTYCLPSTSYVIGPLTICAPRLAFHKSDPVRASSAWK